MVMMMVMMMVMIKWIFFECVLCLFFILYLKQHKPKIERESERARAKIYEIGFLGFLIHTPLSGPNQNRFLDLC